MNDRLDYYKAEFLGEILKYCIDGDYVWFYDEISGGLYRLDKKLYIVKTVLTPMEIHQKSIFSVRQILKWENEIYIIPNDISHEWLIYDIVERRLRKVLLSSQSYVIGNAVNIGKWIYLIPEKTSQILAMVETKTLNIKMITTNWYQNDFKELDCWGYCVSDNMIYFPIIGSKKIFRIQGKKLVELSLDIEQPIYSISLNRNRIWVLPSEGSAIFLVDTSGRFIDCIEIQIDCNKDTAEQFARIIATDEHIFLFPKHGGQILVLETDSKKWIALGEKEEPFYRSVYQKTRSVPYWGYYYEKNIYLLPLQYRLAKVNTENVSVEYKVLQCTDTFTDKEYMTWVRWFNKEKKTNMYVEWQRDSLRDFLKITSEEGCTDNIRFVGRSIWMMMNNL